MTVCSTSGRDEKITRKAEKKGGTSVAVMNSLNKNSPSIESSDSAQHNERNQETRRNRGARTRRQAPKEGRHVSELIGPACCFPPFV